MKHLLFIILILPWLHAAAQSSAVQTDSITCRIHGSVSERPEANAAFIIEADKDIRIHEYNGVKIIDGKFDFTLRDDMPRAYNVMFDDELRIGRLPQRIFYTGDGEVELKCGRIGAAVRDTVISDISDNVMARNWENERNEKCLDELFGIYAAMEALAHRQGNKPSAESDSLQARAIDLLKQNDILIRRQIAEKASLPGLYTIKHAVRYYKDLEFCSDIDDYIRIFETIYKEKMPSHPYTQEIQSMIDAMKVSPGNTYPDYEITRPDGSKERISNLIKGKTAVINLWASWCRPCRIHSKELIPIYEKYKDKGFTIVAVAREKDNCDAMNDAMLKDGYPWESFVDIDDQDDVWRINQAGNSGGKILLVDSDGRIVGINMPANEIEAYLEKNCK